MQERLTTVTRKGQITIPVEIRRALGLQVGDKVAVTLSEGDKPAAHLRPARSVAERTFGAVTPRRKPEDFRELRRLFEEGQAEEVLEETSQTTDAV